MTPTPDRPAPRCTVNDDGFIYYRSHQVISVLADPDAKHDDVTEMRAALVADVAAARKWDQAREQLHRLLDRARHSEETTVDGRMFKRGLVNGFEIAIALLTEGAGDGG